LQEGIDVIFHEAAMVGLGRGGLDSEGYINTNVVGTIRLMNTIAEQPREARPRLVLASSMAIYGEGAYFCKNCDTERVGSRNRRDLAGHCWDPECYECGEPLEPRPVTENHPTRPDTIYAISKLSQELTCLNLGREFQIPIVALRYHNVYGPRMPRNTPYAGVASIFKSKLLAEQSPILYEDGKQLRDFVHVDDIAQANLLVADAEEDKVAFQTFNVGTGRPHSIAEFAAELTKSLAPGIIPEFPGLYRPGDIRHIFADISKIRRLGFKSKVPFETGVSEFAHEPIRDSPKVVPA
jgi:dTDP-L-rhamnose 4-epimerase